MDVADVASDDVMLSARVRPPEGVATRIHNQLLMQGRSQQWLSGQTGVSQRSISHWMRGRCKPSLDSVEIVAKALGVRPGYLAFGELEATSIVDELHP